MATTDQYDRAIGTLTALLNVAEQEVAEMEVDLQELERAVAEHPASQMAVVLEFRPRG
jgi:hypothetical protein